MSTRTPSGQKLRRDEIANEFGTEHTARVRGSPGALFPSHRDWGGEEILVLEGTVQDELGGITRQEHGCEIRTASASLMLRPSRRRRKRRHTPLSQPNWCTRRPCKNSSRFSAACPWRSLFIIRGCCRVSPRRWPTLRSRPGDLRCARYRPDVFRFALWLARDGAIAEDVVQETFMRAWRASAQRGSRGRRRSNLLIGSSLPHTAGPASPHGLLD
jgi:hypothetical protein